MAAAPIASPATVLMALGAGTALASLPLLFRRVRPNRFYGIRVVAAFASERHWYEINAYGARRFLCFAAIVSILGLALGAYPRAPFWLPIVCLLSTLPLLFWTVRSIKRFAATLKP